jgi:death-on-curing protein
VTTAEPVGLTPTDVLVLHDRLLHEHGGAAGVRDLSRLESALARARHQLAYGERDLFMLATAYAAGLTRNHPFVDGNKRTAFMTVFVFLGVNGQNLLATETEVVRAVLALTDKSIGEEEFARWLRANCVAQTGRPRPKTKRARRWRPKTNK